MRDGKEEEEASQAMVLVSFPIFERVAYYIENAFVTCVAVFRVSTFFKETERTVMYTTSVVYVGRCPLTLLNHEIKTHVSGHQIENFRTYGVFRLAWSGTATGSLTTTRY